MNITQKNKPSISFVLHAHQPLRYDSMEINEGIYKRCYVPNIRLKNLENISLNVSGSVLLDLLVNRKNETCSEIINGLDSAVRLNEKNKGISNFLLQASVFHSIVPLLPEKSKILQYEWSKKIFSYFFSSGYSGIWFPELAFDKNSLNLFNQETQWVVFSEWAAKNKMDVSVPYFLKDTGEICLFYNRILSDKISWRSDVWNFKESIRQKNNLDKFSWLLAMDFETFGEHGTKEEKEFGPWWLNNLIYHQIPGEDYNIETVQKILLSADLIGNNKNTNNIENLVETIELKDSGSWSCLCDTGLLRWATICNCVNYPKSDENSWKIPFKGGLTEALAGLHKLYDISMKDTLKNPFNALVDYFDMKLRAIGDNLTKPYFDEFLQKNFNSEEREKIIEFFSFAESIFYMEAAQTSCGTFWESPKRLEPAYNTVSAANSIAIMQTFYRSYGSKDKINKTNAEFNNLKTNLETSLKKTDASIYDLYSDVIESYNSSKLVKFKYENEKSCRMNPNRYTSLAKIMSFA